MRVEFIVLGGHAAKLLGPAEQPLDWVALYVAGNVVGAWVPPLASGRNHGAGAAWHKDDDAPA
jgi:hypothetical protein